MPEKPFDVSFLRRDLPAGADGSVSWGKSSLGPGRSLRAELLIADLLLLPRSADRKFLPSALSSEEAVKAAYARIT